MININLKEKDVKKMTKTKRQCKRLLALILSLLTVTGILSIPVSAAAAFSACLKAGSCREFVDYHFLKKISSQTIIIMSLKLHFKLHFD